MIPSDANFILVKVDDANLRYQQFIDYGIVIRNRSNQPLCENCLRITIGTKEENEKLNSRDVGLRTATISDDNIWLRYNNKKFKIKIAMNRSKNLFFEYHKKDMLNAMVL